MTTDMDTPATGTPSTDVVVITDGFALAGFRTGLTYGRSILRQHREHPPLDRTLDHDTRDWTISSAVCALIGRPHHAQYLEALVLGVMVATGDAIAHQDGDRISVITAHAARAAAQAAARQAAQQAQP